MSPLFEANKMLDMPWLTAVEADKLTKTNICQFHFVVSSIYLLVNPYFSCLCWITRISAAQIIHIIPVDNIHRFVRFGRRFFFSFGPGISCAFREFLACGDENVEQKSDARNNRMWKVNGKGEEKGWRWRASGDVDERAKMRKPTMPCIPNTRMRHWNKGKTLLLYAKMPIAIVAATNSKDEIEFHALCRHPARVECVACTAYTIGKTKHKHPSRLEHTKSIGERRQPERARERVSHMTKAKDFHQPSGLDFVRCQQESARVSFALDLSRAANSTWLLD